MTLKRTSFLTSGYLFIGFFLLLAWGIARPATAGTHRAQGKLTTSATVTKLSFATVLRGRASWYGREHQGMRTSSGERFNRNKYTCAHKSLPFGTRLRVTNMRTGKSVIVRVSDRGPFRHQRILDLAEVAARPLGIVAQGAASVIAQVVPATTPLGPTARPANLLALQAADPNPTAAFTTYELTTPSDSLTLAASTSASEPASTSQAANIATEQVTSATDLTTTSPRFVVQVGTFASVQNAQNLRAHLLGLDPSLSIELTQEIINEEPRNRVIVNQLDSWLAAESVRRCLQAWGVTGLVRQTSGQPLVAANVVTTAAPR